MYSLLSMFRFVACFVTALLLQSSYISALRVHGTVSTGNRRPPRSTGNALHHIVGQQLSSELATNLNAEFDREQAEAVNELEEIGLPTSGEDHASNALDMHPFREGKTPNPTKENKRKSIHAPRKTKALSPDGVIVDVSPKGGNARPFSPTPVAALPFDHNGGGMKVRPGSWNGRGSLPFFSVLHPVEAIPHDIYAFTEGLCIEHDVLYESTGLWHGQSSLQVWDMTVPANRTLIYRDTFANDVFTEGITVWSQNVFQMTYRNSQTYIYDVNELGNKQTRRFPPDIAPPYKLHEYQKTQVTPMDPMAAFQHLMRLHNHFAEAWGVTSCDTYLYVSNGSHWLMVVDPAHFHIVGSIKVRTRTHHTISGLNELEYIPLRNNGTGEIWANHIQSECVVRIDPLTGYVLGWIWGPDLYKGPHRAVNMMNGIAFDKAKYQSSHADGQAYQFWVTGKKWPNMYLTEVKEPIDAPDVEDYAIPYYCRTKHLSPDDVMYSTLLAQGGTAEGITPT